MFCFIDYCWGNFILILAPRMLDSAVFAEYGWQGGKPLITFNLFLIILGSIAGWKLRSTVEGRLLITWFVGLWLLTSIHLMKDLRVFPFFHYFHTHCIRWESMHSMSISSLVALWWSPSTGLTSLEEKRGLMTIGWIYNTRKDVKNFNQSYFNGVLIANSIVWQIASHDELRPITQGDLEIREKLSNLPEGSIVYSGKCSLGSCF